MKRKFLIFLLTIVSAICICVGFSACDLLDSLIDITQTLEDLTDSDSTGSEDGGATIYGKAVIGTYYGSDMLIVYGTVAIDCYISANETSYYNVYMQEGAALTINNVVYNIGSKKTVYILFRLDSADKYPALYLGNVEAQTNLYISGNISSTEAATPSNLSCAIATLGSADEFANVKIYFENVDRTFLYSVNANNEIVYSA